MLNPNSTIYQGEWLDLVFAQRNKAYGAYELRQNYSKRLLTALFITLSTVALIVAYVTLGKQSVTLLVKPQKKDPPLVVTLIKLPSSRSQASSANPPSAKKETIKSTKGLIPVAVTKPSADKPVLPSEQHFSPNLLPEGLGIEDVSGNGLGVESMGSGGPGTDMPGPATETIHSMAHLSQYPEFPGGKEAFMRFLRKYLRYPESALQNEVSGKVFVSFIVERDGRLTDIKIVRGIGYGCDEEAARVLKMSPSWKPGVQNSSPVRVQYTLPLNFSLAQ